MSRVYLARPCAKQALIAVVNTVTVDRCEDRNCRLCEAGGWFYVWVSAFDNLLTTSDQPGGWVPCFVGELAFG